MIGRKRAVAAPPGTTRPRVLRGGATARTDTSGDSHGETMREEIKPSAMLPVMRACGADANAPDPTANR